jgi:hypothetical protein
MPSACVLVLQKVVHLFQNTTENCPVTGHLQKQNDIIDTYTSEKQAHQNLTKERSYDLSLMTTRVQLKAIAQPKKKLT